MCGSSEFNSVFLKVGPTFPTQSLDKTIYRNDKKQFGHLSYAASFMRFTPSAIKSLIRTW
jgi:hypothetical protein